jgi:succinoglycan biosynthesis protein ExoL
VRLVYFVHNLNDPAVARRLAMLKAAGVETLVAGFWRGSPPPREIEGAKAVALGQSHDARLLHRAFLTVKNALFPSLLPDEVAGADLLMARNLEMLAIAVSASRRMRRPRVAYEVLDIHRLLLAPNIAGRCLRAVERALMRKVRLLLVSSPAFLREYFERFQFGQIETALLENKILELERGPAEQSGFSLAAGPPWRIGWLGMIRCRRSLEMLCNLARKRPELLEVRIFGRPTRELSQDIDRITPSLPGVMYGGAYAPDDLPALYRQTHFNWAIDYYEENANSLWLLPNRIYEGGRHGVIPLALQGTETARWLAGLGLGASFRDPELELESFLDGLTPERYREMKRACSGAPRAHFAAGQSDCDRLGHLLSRAAHAAPEITDVSMACNEH